MTTRLPPGLQRYTDRIRHMSRVRVAVGILGTEETTAIGDLPGSGREPSDPETLAQIAMRHEEGDGVPRRPFLSRAFEEYHRDWVQGAIEALPQTDSPPGHEEAGLRALGVVMVGDVQWTLRMEAWAPNSDATIAAKGSDQPLIDTGQLVQSVRAAAEEWPHPGASTLVG